MEFFQRTGRRRFGVWAAWAVTVVTASAVGAVSCAGNRAGVRTALAQSLTADATNATLAASMCGARSNRSNEQCAARVKDVHADAVKFYQSRGGEPVWVNGRRPGSAATIALAAFSRAAEHGFSPERYGAAALKAEADRLTNDSGSPGEALARFDLNLTAALLALGRDVAIGKPGDPPTGIGDRRRTPPDFPARLASVIDEGDFTLWPDDVRPVHPQYAALQAAMAVAGGRQPAEVSNIARNLERWRWMPDDLGARHLVVNIPSFHLWVYDNARPVFDSRVIVGKLGDETPIFSANMTTVVFSPYWNIPESIAEGETVPSIVKNPEFLAKNRIEVLRRSDGSVERVDPSTVNWNDPSETSEISLRQRPGPGNALGNIKFLLPNRHNVYLHDTPTLNLFNRGGRAFSHGCVRVQEPVELAKYLLAGEPKWTDEAIRRAMKSGEEQGAKLRQPLPVHIVYFTAWAEPDGKVTVLKDVYGRDR